VPGPILPVEQSGRERVRPNGTDSLDVSPLLRARADQSADAAEVGEQRTGNLGGDTRHGGEYRKTGFRQLRYRTGATTSTRFPGVTHCKTVEPQCGVRRIAAPQERHAKLYDRQESTANRVWMPRAAVGLVALDQQKWRNGLIADLPHLVPEPSTTDRSVKVGHRLAFDEDAATNAVVAGRQRFDGDERAEPLECSRDTAPALEHIRRNERSGLINLWVRSVTVILISCSLKCQQDGAAPVMELLGLAIRVYTERDEDRQSSSGR